MEKYLSKNTQNSVDFNQIIKLPRNKLKSLQLENMIKQNENQTSNYQSAQINSNYLGNIQEVAEELISSLPSNLKSLTTDQSSSSKSMNDKNYLQIVGQENIVHLYNSPSSTMKPIQYIQVDTQQSLKQEEDQQSKQKDLKSQVTSQTIAQAGLNISTTAPTIIKDQELIHNKQTQTQRRLAQLQQHENQQELKVKNTVIQLYFQITDELKNLQKQVSMGDILEIQQKVKKPSNEIKLTYQIIIKLAQIMKNKQDDIDKAYTWDYIIKYFRSHPKLYLQLQQLSILFDNDIHERKDILNLKVRIENIISSIQRDKSIFARILIACNKLIKLQIILFGQFNLQQATEFITQQKINKHQRSKSQQQFSTKLIIKNKENQQPSEKHNQQHSPPMQNSRQFESEWGSPIQVINKDDGCLIYEYDQHQVYENPKVYLNEQSKVIHIDLQDISYLNCNNELQQQQFEAQPVQDSHWSFQTPQTPQKTNKQQDTLIKIENQGYSTSLQTQQKSEQVVKKTLSQEQQSKNVKGRIKKFSKTRKACSTTTNTKHNSKSSSLSNSIIYQQSENKKSQQQNIMDLKRTNLNPLFQSREVVNRTSQNKFQIQLNPLNYKHTQNGKVLEQQKKEKSQQLEQKREMLIQQWTKTLLQEQDLQDKIRQRLEHQLLKK